MNPSPDELEAAADKAFMQDLVALCWKHKRMPHANVDDAEEPIIFLHRLDEPPVHLPGALLLFPDRELRFCGELRDPEDVVAQVAWPQSGHEKMAAAARVAGLGGSF